MRIPRLGLALGASAAGKLLGFVRLQAIVVVLGTTASTDALLLALTLLSLFDAVFVSGGAILIAQATYAKSHYAGLERLALHRLALSASTWGVCALAFGAVVLFANSLLVAVIAPGFDPESGRLFLELMVVGVLLPFVTTLMVFASTVNRVHGREALYASNQIVINGLAIAALMLASLASLDSRTTAMLVVTSTVAATSLMVLVQYRLGRRYVGLGFFNAVRRVFAVTRARRHAKIASTDAIRILPLVVALLLQQTFSLVSMSYATRSGAGALTVLGISDRLVNVVLMLFTATFLTILEPHWARQAADRLGHSKIRADIRFILLLMFPISITLSLAARDITNVLFGFGQAENVELTTLTDVLGISAISLPFASYSLLAARALIAIRAIRGVAWISGGSLLLHVLVCALVEPSFGIQGIAASAVAAQAAQATAFSFLARRSLAGEGNKGDMVRAVAILVATIGPAMFAAGFVLPSTLAVALVFFAATLGFIAGCGVTREPILENARRLYRL